MISGETVNNLVLGAGTATVGGVDIGATEGGSEFWCEVTTVAPKMDGARGPVKGAVWITVLVPKIKLRMKEMTLARLQLAYAGSTLASDGSSETLTHTPGKLADSDFRDVVFSGVKSNGKPVQITVENAACLDQVTLAFTDEQTQIYEVVLTGHYDPATPTKAPYEIVNTV
jgi:hypothetical protein